MTALRPASPHGRMEIVQLLLDKGAHVDARGGLCAMPVQLALERGHTNNVECLLDKNACL